MIPVTDHDLLLGYEVNSISKQIINVFLVPVLDSLPTGIRKYLKKSHKAGKEIIEHATTHKALEILYGHGSAKARGNLIQNFFNGIWLSTNNAKAVRNRLKLVKREITNQIVSLNKSGGEIKITSIASGSARAITESLDDALKSLNASLSVTFVDKNPLAIEYSRELASSSRFINYFNWINDTAGSFFRSNTGIGTFNLVEIVGLIDYFSDEKAITMFSMIYESLDRDGMMITANICDNSEKEFIDRVLGWKMIYRTADQLKDVVIKSGFSEDKIRIIFEPLMIHCVVVAYK